MKNKKLLFAGIALIVLVGIVFVLVPALLILGAGSLFIITRASGEQPAPVVESVSVVGSYEAVLVDQAEVEVGAGSPIPVHVLVSGTLPDTCAQVENVEQKRDGSNFILTVSTVPSRAGDCIPDGIPFKMTIPLNVVELPAGTYAVWVNGTRASFKLDGGSSSSDR